MSAVSAPATTSRLLPAKWALRGVDALTRFINSPSLRVPSERLLTLLLAQQRFLPTERLEKTARAYLRNDTPCASQPTSPHYRFVHWYQDLFGERTIGRARAFFEHAPPRNAALRLDRFLRLAILAELRAAVLARYRGHPGVPSVPLNQAQLSLYPLCDLSCEGCYTAEERIGKPPTRADIEWLIDELAFCGAHFIHLIGKGEPFLSATFTDALLEVLQKRPHLLFTIVTHGMRITPTLAARLAALGNVIVLVSIDGPQPIHDARRGAGSYEKARAGMAHLAAAGVLFGYSTTVSSRSYAAVTEPSYVHELARAGASVGMYSRYFPLSPERSDELCLSRSALADYRAAFVRIRDSGPIPLLDLDDIEAHTGCHSRAGEIIYVDGVSGAVTPCLRVPFAPAECNISRQSGRRLVDVLAHPFFVDYRKPEKSCGTHCGANLAAELTAVGDLLGAHGGNDARLLPYRDRSPTADGPRHRALPILE